MGRVVWGLLLVTLLGVACSAQTYRHMLPGYEYRTVTFHTTPDRAKILFINNNNQFLGYSGEPIQVPVSLGFNVTMEFAVVRDGYQDGQYWKPSLSMKDERPYDFPDDGTGSIVLVPQRWTVYVGDLLGRHPAILSAAVGVGVLALLVLGLYARRVSRRARRATALGALGLGRPPAGDMSLAGKSLGRWVLVDKLGKGGMAVVYRGVPLDSLDARQAVAVKVIHADRILNPESRARFEREVRIGARLSHPNIVRLVDWDLSGPAYIVMELIDGEPLRTRIGPGGLPPATVRKLAGPVFQAMIYAHEQGVWHRDLKPENIFVSKDDRVTVMDFGISRQATDVTLTHTGNMPVTPAYMSPEQFSGKEVQGASDQYSLGIVVWEMLAGQRPFDDESPLVIMAQQISNPLPSIRDKRPAVREEVDWVLQRMCAKNPLMRFPTLSTAWEALDNALGL